MENESDEVRKELARARYDAAAHAMQSGVATSLPWSDECSPKHLRVGVNSAMSDHGALVTLLIAKGVFTEVEYFEAIASGMERERDSYVARIQERYPGTRITLA